VGSLENKKLYLRAFGCQMNVFDGEVISDMLLAQGCSLCSSPAEADIAIYVTCSVRAHAENRVFSLIGKLQNIKKERNGLPLIGIMGCTAEKLGDEYPERFPGIDFVIGTRNIDRVIHTVQRACNGESPIVLTGLEERSGILDYAPHAVCPGFSAYVPVSRGCSRRCTYCIVPHVRGDMVSRDKTSILRDIRTHADRGCVEVTLLGQNIDAYGRDRKKKGLFADLLEEAARVPGLKRLKFLTSHPGDFSLEILNVIKDNPVISPFFHLPPQSGSDPVLKKMRRGYTREYYLDLTDRIYSELPQASIAGDIIVGFPGETDRDFEQSEDLLRKVGFQQAYIFKYSPRENTYAGIHMEDTVPLNVKKERNNRLLAVQEEIQLKKHRSFIGKNVDILVEGPSKKNGSRYFGRTDTNFRVVFPSSQEHPGDTVSVAIESVSPLTLFGERCNE